MDNVKKECCTNGGCCSNKLSVCNLGMSLGIVWGLYMFIVAMLSMTIGMGTPFVEIFSYVYYGFAATLIGSVIGLAWGFVHGFIFGALLAFFYNFCHCKCPCKTCKETRKCE